MQFAEIQIEKMKRGKLWLFNEPEETQNEDIFNWEAGI